MVGALPLSCILFFFFAGFLLLQMGMWRKLSLRGQWGSGQEAGGFGVGLFLQGGEMVM